MEELNLTNKYRPQKLDDIVGQEVVVQTLKNSFESNTLHSTYLFAGNFGCGKTTTARILAASENCENGPTLEPCGKCDNCKAIFSGKSMDIKELNAANNRSIDDIRALANEIRMRPMSGSVKYIIIDEAHSLTGTAAEAALKMIEEPPTGVRFILCTTSAHKILDTIKSRCQTHIFKKVHPTELFHHLRKISDAEKFLIDDEALQLAAKASQGSVRNAIQNLQGIVQYAGIGIKATEEKASEKLGEIPAKSYFYLFNHMLTFETTKAILIIDEFFEHGASVDKVIEGLVLVLRNAMLCNMCPKGLNKLGFIDVDIVRYTSLAEAFGTGEKAFEAISNLLDKLKDVNDAIERNIDPQTALQAYVLKSIIWLRNRDPK